MSYSDSDIERYYVQADDWEGDNDGESPITVSVVYQHPPKAPFFDCKDGEIRTNIPFHRIQDSVEWISTLYQMIAELESHAENLEHHNQELSNQLIVLDQENHRLRAENYWLRAEGAEKYNWDDDSMPGASSEN